MLNNYIVRLKDNRLFCFYHTREEGLMFRVYDKNKWQQSTKLINCSRDNFTVTLDDNGIMYIFCQDAMGNVIMCTYQNEAWSQKMILANQSNKIHTIQFNPIISDTGLCLLYNVPSNDDKGHYMIIQELDENGTWSPSTRIDKFVNMSNYVFLMQPITAEHSILFYQTRTPENNIGYREITRKKQGRYNIFHTTNNQIIDTAFLTTGNTIHVLFTVKSMFSCQLIYRRKESNQFSNPIVLWEGQKIDTILLFFVRDNLYVTYLVNGQLYVCISDDLGKTFSKPARYQNRFCATPTKAQYITELSQRESLYFAREVYVDKENPWDVQLLPSLMDDFYPSETQTPPPAIPAKSLEIDNETIETINKLQNQLEMAERQLREKDQQIIHLTSLLKAKNAEISQIHYEKNDQLKTLHSQKQEIEKKFAEFTTQMDTEFPTEAPLEE